MIPRARVLIDSYELISCRYHALMIMNDVGDDVFDCPFWLCVVPVDCRILEMIPIRKTVPIALPRRCMQDDVGKIQSV